ncbi:polymer-forming cytoskeletal protein [Wansuia hejianensis]|uniref:Polymer-forming cytoskeletal protein n=1 Tax=Wansuia hejianensis TaxID=2763667 RepID=A0A926F0J4_9FIRM|nr:polymer-forming cytoskeletal protein [Wansuia hejianensis]MBC8589660.1 hypothetical protein [Wansuia hejianensis]
MSYDYDYINGRKVPQMVISEDTIISGVHHGTVHVERGVLTISGKLYGTLDAQSDTKVVITGEQHGTVNVNDNALVIVSGKLHGTTSVSYNGTIEVENTGKLVGTLNNRGTVIVRGGFGGVLSGNGVILEGNGYIKQPKVENGINYYE